MAKINLSGKSIKIFNEFIDSALMQNRQDLHVNPEFITSAKNIIASQDPSVRTRPDTLLSEYIKSYVNSKNAQESQLKLSSKSTKIISKLIDLNFKDPTEIKDLAQNPFFLCKVRDSIKEHEPNIEIIQDSLLSKFMEDHINKSLIPRKSEPQPIQSPLSSSSKRSISPKPRLEKLVLTPRANQIFKNLLLEKVSNYSKEEISSNPSILEMVKDALKSHDPNIEYAPDHMIIKEIETFFSQESEPKTEIAAETIPKNQSVDSTSEYSPQQLFLTPQTKEIFNKLIEDKIKQDPQNIDEITQDLDFLNHCVTKLKPHDNAITLAPKFLITKYIEEFVKSKSPAKKFDTGQVFKHLIQKPLSEIEKDMLLMPEVLEDVKKAIDNKLAASKNVSDIANDQIFVSLLQNQIQLRGNKPVKPEVLQNYIQNYVKSEESKQTGIKKVPFKSFIFKKSISSQEVKQLLDDPSLSEGQISKELSKKIIENSSENNKASDIKEFLFAVSTSLKEINSERAKKVDYYLNIEISKVLNSIERGNLPLIYDTPARRDAKDSPTPRQLIRDLLYTPQIVSPINERSSFGSVDPEMIARLEEKPKVLELESALRQKDVIIEDLKEKLKSAAEKEIKLKSSYEHKILLQASEIDNDAYTKLMTENKRLRDLLIEQRKSGNSSFKDRVFEQEAEIKELNENRQSLLSRLTEYRRENEKTFELYQEKIRIMENFYLKNSNHMEEQLNDIITRETYLIEKESEIREAFIRLKNEKIELDSNIKSLNDLKVGSNFKIGTFELILCSFIALICGILLYKILQ